MIEKSLSVYEFEHPKKAELERLWTLEADLQRTLQALDLLVGPPEFFRVAGFLASALYTQALVSYIRCFTSGRRKGIDRSMLDSKPDLQKIHDDVKLIRDQHVSHPVSDYERCTLLLAANSSSAKPQGLGVHHLFFSGAGPKDLKDFRRLVKYVHKEVVNELNQIGTVIARDLIGPRITWRNAQKKFWRSVNGEDVYGPGW